jgi:MFS superfamily sulfate permease-like transporter
MNARARTTVLLVGSAVSIPLLFIYYHGVFKDSALWLEARLRGTLRLQEAALPFFLPIQYAVYTLLSFSSAWLAYHLEPLWKKHVFALILSFLLFMLSPLLALNGYLFEPFSGILAVWLATLITIIATDKEVGVVDEVPAPLDTKKSEPAASEEELITLGGA